MNSLAETQREIIRQHEPETEEVDTRPDDVNLKISKDKDVEEKVYCLPKCFLLGIALVLLLAGLIVLVYFYRDKGPADGLRGDIYKDKIPKEECPDISVVLGEEIKIKCQFETNAIPGDVHAVYRNLVGATISDFECIKSGHEVNCTAKGKANCSSHGDVIIRFFDSYGDDKTVVYTDTVRVNVTVPDTSVDTEIEQIYSESISQSEFRLMCKYEKDCRSYEMAFFVNNAIIPDTKTCTTSFSDEKGYSLACSATVPSQVILHHGNRSRLYCRFVQGTHVEKKPVEFKLPVCNDYSVGNANCSAETTSLYDCKDTLSVQQNCTRKCLVSNECFPVRVSSTDCCALTWCRNNDTSEIDSSGRLSFEHLCPPA